MAKPFIPNRDSELDAWLLNFSTKLSAGPASYGLTPADAAEVAAVYASWHTAFLTASSPATRTSPVVKAKDDARAAAVSVVRKYAALIRADQGIALDLKLSLGLRVRKRGLTPANPPAAVPILSVAGLDFARHELVVSNEAASGRRGKPHGAASLLVLRTISDRPVMHPDNAQFLTLATRTRFSSDFTTQDSGKVATYFARWANAKGELGPWSAACSMRIAA